MPSIIESEGSGLGDDHWVQARESGIGNSEVETNYSDERRIAILAAADSAKLEWFHIKVSLVAGIGFFTDAYNIFAINIASVMIGYVYGSGDIPPRALTTTQDFCLKVATPVGTFVGQLVFGWLADVYGRRKMYGFELIIIIVATFGQAVLSGSSPTVHIVAMLAIWRTILGIGIGGDYPVSAVITSEFAAVDIRGRMMSSVFAAQGLGAFLAASVACAIIRGHEKAILAETSLDNLESIDFMWRLLLGLGAVPGVFALYFRFTIPETPRFTMDIKQNLERASRDIKMSLRVGEDVVVGEDAPEDIGIRRNTLPNFWDYFKRRENWLVLFGTAYSWFALDVAFYGLGFNSAKILRTIGYGGPSKDLDPGSVGDVLQEIVDNLQKVSIGNLILVSVSLPGYLFAVLSIDRVGRKTIQYMGFAMLTIIFVIMAGAYNVLVDTQSGLKAFFALYCFANFFQNFGPNTTTFIIPGELFPTRYRSTAHGISAATGKFGAIIGQIVFSVSESKGSNYRSIQIALGVFGLFMFTGLLSTLLIPETKKKSLEVLSNDTQTVSGKGKSRRRGF